MNILLAPVEIAGYMGKVRDGLKMNGQNARLLNFEENYMRYEEYSEYPLLRWFHSKKQKNAASRSFINRAIFFVLAKMIRVIYFIYSLVWPDCVIFGFAKTILGGWELPIYKALGIRIVLIYFGSDSRPVFLNGAVVTNERGVSIDKCFNLAKKQKKRITWLDRFADIIIDHPPSAQFHEKPFIPFLYLGMPIPKAPERILAQTHAKDVSPCRAPIRILHAPSFPEAKGTQKIRDAIKALADEGFAIEYIEIIKKPNSEVLDQLEKCDFVIDELYSDSVLAGLGAEAAVFGKAVIVGGYVCDEDLGVKPSLIPPAIRTRPEEFLDCLRRTILTSSYIDIGKKAQQFILREWEPKHICKKLLEVIEDNGATVLYDPKSIVYFHGWGFALEKHKAFLAEYIARHGPSALCLSDKPALIQSLLGFAFGGTFNDGTNAPIKRKDASC